MSLLRRTFKWLFTLCLVLALCGAATLAVLYWLVAPGLPSVQALRDVQYQVPLSVYSADGKLIALFGETRRTPVAIQDVPLQVRRAFIAIEDARFYEHPGVDWRGTARAVWLLATTDDRRVPGGSTITQQVARMFFLSPEYSYTRKFREMLLALKMERELEKDEILGIYLNKSFFGNRAYGIVAAAEFYYGKPLAELSLAEAATLASIPKFPSSGNPIINPERALVRRNYVLQRMREENLITPAQEQAAQKPATSAPAPSSNGGSGAAVSYALSQVGKRYVLGGTGPSSYDCSGLTMMAWRNAGVSLPHFSGSQYQATRAVPTSQIQPGDLLFFYSISTHVGMYIGNGQFVHAANPSRGVVVDSLNSYYKSNLVAASRP